MVETQFGFDYRSIMDPEPGRCRRTDGKKWRCGKDVIPDQKYCERHMHRGRGRSRKLVEASEISLESVPVNLQLANPSPKSNSNNSIGKAHATSSISSISGSENRVCAEKESTAAATASPTINGIDKESNKNVYHSKDTVRPMTTTGLWTAGSDQINKCTSDSNSSIGKAPATSAISSICGSGNKIYGKKDPSAAATATPTTNNVDKDGGKNIHHSKDTTWSTTIGGPWRAGFESKCTSKSERVDGKDAAYKHLNNITIGQSKNYRHAGTAGSPVASRLGFSPDSILQGCSSSCLKYRIDVEPELQRCRRTDGKKWRCGTDVLPNQKYCEQHLHRGAKKPMVAEPVKVALAPLPLDICRVTPLAIPKKGSGYINLNTNLSLSIAAIPQQTANKEKGNTSSSSSNANTISDDNDSWSVQNDVPSGENISYNNRDYTLEFNTDQVFESRDAMLDWVRKIGLENGIVVVIQKSANLKGGKRPKCILGCERGGRYKPHRNHVEGQSMQRNTGTRKCDCPFELRGIPIPPNYVMWGLSVLCGFHNHEPAK